jgi:hypothetical protein
VRDLLGVCVERKVLGNLPDEDLAVLGGRGDDAIVERVPVGVEYGGGMSPEEGNLVGQLALLVERDDGERAAARGVPIDRQVLGVDLGEMGLVSVSGGRRSRARQAHLDQVRVPGIATDVEVVVAELLPGGLPENVS